MNQTLPSGTLLQGNGRLYTIDRVLGHGGYGITYLGNTLVKITGDLGEIETNVQVTIKEFFMDEFMTRSGNDVVRTVQDPSIDLHARQFFLEAAKMAQLSHPNIAKVLEVFIANDTCYYVMEYMPGGSLDDFIRQREGVPETEAIRCIRQIGSALSHMHEHKMLHLDVKPANVMRSPHGTRLKLIDFGFSKQYKADGEAELDEKLGCGTQGYASLEQAEGKVARHFTPMLDVYGLGATYYKLLTGQTPDSAIDIINHGINPIPLVSKKVSQQSIDAIKAAMHPDPNLRLQSVEAFLEMLPPQEAQDLIPKGHTHRWHNLMNKILKIKHHHLHLHHSQG